MRRPLFLLINTTLYKVTNMKFTYKKLVISGSIVELCEYEKPNYYDYQSNSTGKTLSSGEDGADEKSKESSMFRAKAKIRHLISANVGAYTYGNRNKKSRSLMITLTFAENTTDLTAANYQYMLFIQRLNDYCFGAEKSKLKYVVVIEFQKRGAVHYHAILFNLPHLKNVYKEIKSIWKQGRVYISPVGNAISAARYVTKYITKELGDKRLRGRKRYFSSNGLHEPIEVKDENIVRSIIDILPKSSIVYSDEFEHQKCGKTIFTRYEVPAGINVKEYFEQICGDKDNLSVNLRSSYLKKHQKNDKVAAPTSNTDIKGDCSPEVVPSQLI